MVVSAGSALTRANACIHLVLGDIDTHDNKIALCHHPLPSLLGTGSKPLQLFGLRKTPELSLALIQARSLLGRNGLSSSSGRFCENRPFAHPARFPGHKGRTRRHERRVRDAMDASACPDEAHRRGRRNRVVLTPRRWRQVLEGDSLQRRRGLSSSAPRGDRV